jgi:pimeloyl-ACP methyl ester carboxylesterase
MAEREVSFYSDGEKVSGTLTIPDGHAPSSGYPVVLLAHGFGSFRDELTGFVELADKFSERIYASLRFDFRGCGKSGQSGKVHPFPEWIEDMEAAIDFVGTLDEMDHTRTGIVGMSVGGGVVCWTGAIDPRVKSIVALAPVADGEWWLEHLWKDNLGDKGWSDFKARIAEDAEKRVVNETPRKVPVGDILAYGPEDRRIAVEIFSNYPQFVKEMYLSSALHLIQFKPLALAHRIEKTPIRFIHSEDDTSVPIRHSEALYAEVGGAKDFQRIEGSPHCFWVGTKSELVQELTIDWITQYV